MDLELRFGMHRDIPIIHDSSALLDGLVIPAHILAYQTPSTASFVTSLPGKNYVIDPMTFIFQNPRHHHLSESNPSQLRPSVGQLCDEYHPALRGAVQARRQMAPENFPDLHEFCEGVAEFQLTTVERGAATSAANKYLERYGETRPTQPSYLLPPYFRFENVGDAWYRLSVRCAEIFAEMELPLDVAPVICCPAATVERAANEIAEAYAAFPNLYLWLDDYQERQAAAGEIRSVKRYIRRLSERSNRLATLYGGYLLVTSHHDGLNAVSHGILYTQHKSFRLTPGGGGPPERFYIPRFHQFRSLSQTDLIIHQHPELICNCAICQEVLGGDPDNIIRYYDEPELLRRHFLTVRRTELDEIRGRTEEQLAGELQNTYETYHESISRLPNPDAVVSDSSMRGLGYLAIWSEAIG